MRGRKQKASAGRFPCTAALRLRRAPLLPMRDPPPLQIGDIIVLCTNQSAAKTLARVGPSLGGPS